VKTFPGSPIAANGGGVWWSRDGDALLYTTPERANVWRQRLAGGPPVRVTAFADGITMRGDLSPDRRTLVAFRGNPLRDAFLITGFR
jgi:hypothetical protein